MGENDRMTRPLDDENRQRQAAEYPAAPQVAVGAVVFHRGRVLLVRRSNPPAKDQWAIPGGRVKLGESLRQAAERETREETGVRVAAKDPVFTFEVIDRDSRGNVRFHYLIVDLEAEFKDDFPAPFVKESPVQIGLKFREQIDIPLNGTLLMIGEVMELYLPEDCLQADGYLDIEKAGTIAVSSLDGYHATRKLARLSYAKPDRDVAVLEEKTS